MLWPKPFHMHSSTFLVHQFQDYVVCAIVHEVPLLCYLQEAGIGKGTADPY